MATHIIVPAGVITPPTPRALTAEERTRIADLVTADQLERLATRLTTRPAPRARRREIVRPVLNNGWSVGSSVRTI